MVVLAKIDNRRCPTGWLKWPKQAAVAQRSTRRPQKALGHSPVWVRTPPAAFHAIRIRARDCARPREVRGQSVDHRSGDVRSAFNCSVLAEATARATRPSAELGGVTTSRVRVSARVLPWRRSALEAPARRLQAAHRVRLVHRTEVLTR